MRWFLILILGLNVAMCGQKGPLSLPEEEPAAIAAAEAGPTSSAGLAQNAGSPRSAASTRK
jgi:predicted small lipoprotein YifL